MTQIWITKTSDENLQFRQQELLYDIERLSLTLEDNKMLLNEYNEELKKRGLIKFKDKTSDNPALNIADVGVSPAQRYRNALESLGGEYECWRIDEYEDWVLSQYSTYVLNAIKISSGIED